MSGTDHGKNVVYPLFTLFIYQMICLTANLEKSVLLLFSNSAV